MTCRVDLTFTSTRASHAVAQMLEETLIAGPLTLTELTQAGPHQWSATLGPLRTGLTIGFAKVAEILVLIAREVTVETVSFDSDARASAVAS